MTKKQIDTSREIRLWVALALTALVAVPEVRQKVKTTVIDVKNRIQTKFKKN